MTGQSFLEALIAPAVEAAGYRVIGDADESHADLVIATQGDPISDAAHAIVLRDEREPAGKKDESIYRYDRAGLLTALKSVSAGRGK